MPQLQRKPSSVVAVGRYFSQLAPAQSAWEKVRLTLSAFFFASDGEESGDHLVEVVRLDAAAASWFIELSALFSIAGGICVIAACTLFLSIHWERCSDCNRPLRLWLVAQVLLQVLQLPVRVVLCSCVRAISRAGGNVEACVLSITMAPAWRMSKVVSMAHYGWFVLGVIWWVNSHSCHMCPGISSLLISVLLLCATRSIVALGVFHLLFPAPAEQARQASGMEPATASQIAALAVVTIKLNGPDPGPGTSCVVCLNDFEDGDKARKLPCSHHFHKGCIGRWLQRSKRCPLCMHPVDKVFLGHPCVHPKTM